MTLIAFDLTTGERVRIGDRIVDSRGEPNELRSIERVSEPGRDGKVAGLGGMPVYARVFNLRVEESDDA